MKRIFFILSLLFVIVVCIAQNTYTVSVRNTQSDNTSYAIEQKIKTNITGLTATFVFRDYKKGQDCYNINFRQVSPYSFTKAIRRNIYTNANSGDNSFQLMNGSTILYFSNGTTYKTKCTYVYTSIFSTESDSFTVGFEADRSLQEIMGKNSLIAMSILGKRVNFVNFSSVKAISAITKKIEDNSIKDGNYNGTRICLRCRGTGKSASGLCARCGGMGKCND